ncbi:hypothetical protein ACP70R_009353 [Stipagrostis hirtigluma subsp. patula]
MAHIQLRVLHALDAAKTQWYHFTAVVIAGMGFFTDAYDLFSISLVMDLIGDPDGSHPLHVVAAITSIALFGTIPGQLIFGWLGDKMGRKRIYGITLILMFLSTLASGLSFSESNGTSVVASLCFFRFWLGVGIGGDYPLSATIMAEYANKRRRGAFMAAIFALQGFGILAAGLVTMAVSAAFGNPSSKTDDYVWRIVLMLGSIPAALTYYWRMKMPETARYTALIANNANKAASDMSAVLNMDIAPEDEALNELASEHQYGLFSTEFLHRHGIHLFTTTVCWLILDISFYSLNLCMKDILFELPPPEKMGNMTCTARNTSSTYNITNMTKMTAEYTAITLGGTLPGYFFSVALLDRIGRIKIQLLGFAMMSIFILCLAPLYCKYWIRNRNGFKAMYAMTFFFANFGPNTTTFIIPAEIFPARLRSTCHGISGAGGKIGAIIGVFGFLYTRDNPVIMLYVLVGCNIIGLVLTCLLPESKGMSLEEITGELVEQTEQDSAQAVAAAGDIQIVPI